MSGHRQVFSLSSSALPPNWRDIVQEEEAKATICQAPSLGNGKLTKALAATTTWMKTLEASHDELAACGLAAEQVSLAEKLQRSHQEGHASSVSSIALCELQCK
jgi:predicted nucleic acid-binding Zn ribbon protein